MRVLVSTNSTFAVNIPKVRYVVGKSLTKLDCSKNAEISISFISREQMTKISRKYLGDRQNHEIISFPFINKSSPSKFPSPDGVSRIGEIVISYPQAVRLANRQKKSIDEEITFLLGHGCRHLLGHHHK